MSLFTFGCKDKTDIQMYNTVSLYGHKMRWIWLPDPLLGRKWGIQKLDPLQALYPKCTVCCSHKIYRGSKGAGLYLNDTERCL